MSIFDIGMDIDMDSACGLNFDKKQCGNFLMDRRQKVLPWKDFGKEIRAVLDTRNLDSEAVLLDVHATDLRVIVKQMTNKLHPLIYDNNAKEITDSKLIVCKATLLYSKIQKELFSLTDSDNFHVDNIEQRLQSIIVTEEGVQEDQSWFILYCSLDELAETKVSFVRLHKPTNFGVGLGDVQFIALVIAPVQQKNTKSAIETARTFATLFANPQLRNLLGKVGTEYEFLDALQRYAEKLRKRTLNRVKDEDYDSQNKHKNWLPFRGIFEDFKRRIKHYKSDFTDGFSNARSIQKTISTAVFLYFSILPTAIALGMLNDENTNGKINVKKEILSQCFGGLLFGIFGGQLFLIMLSTAPISIYIHVIQQISISSNVDFFKIYTCIGLWCAIFLAIFAIFQASIIMKFAKRSLEELFGLFISLALTFEAIKAIVQTFLRYNPNCSSIVHNSTVLKNFNPLNCERSVGLLFVLLTAITLWISITLYSFRSTPYLTRTKRELVSDYALPIGVIIAALIANFLFADIPTETFNYNPNLEALTFTTFWDLDWQFHALSFGLGLPLAILFFMDQMIVTNTVDNKQNNLKKGSSPDWDLLIVAIMNAILSIFGLPWMHGALPQAYLHLKSLADVEDRLVDGTVQQVIVKNRESRLATLIAHAFMIPTYFFLLPYLKYFPTSVFHGLFLYLAFTSTIGNEFCQRLALLFTEQRSYPPYHYNRKVPQRTIHWFTVMELIQLIILFAIGFAPWPIIQLLFPIITFLFIPFRSLVLPLLFNKKYLDSLDGIH